MSETSWKNDAGFTLIETLIVLLVSSLLLLMPTLTLSQAIENVNVELFFRELTANLTLTQNQAIMGGDPTRAVFYGAKEKDRIVFELNASNLLNSEMILDRPFYHLVERGVETFRFKGGTGNVSASSTIKFSTTQGDYHLTYLLGSGRFDIKKQVSK